MLVHHVGPFALRATVNAVVDRLQQCVRECPDCCRPLAAARPDRPEFCRCGGGE